MWRKNRGESKTILNLLSNCKGIDLNRNFAYSWGELDILRWRDCRGRDYKFDVSNFQLSRRNTSSLSWDIHRRLSLFWGQYHNYQIEKSCLKYVSHYYFHFTFCHVWLISGGEPGCAECGAGQQTQTGLLPQLPQLRPENNVPLVILRRKGAIKRAIKR